MLTRGAITAVLALAVAGVQADGNKNYCSQNPYSIMVAYSAYSPAQSYCTQSWLSTVTMTVTDMPTTTVVTETSSVVMTISKRTAYTAAPAVTTSYDPNRFKRGAEVRREAKSSTGFGALVASLAAAGGQGYISSACQCIVSTPTSSVHSGTVNTVTSTTTTTVLSIVTLYATSTSMESTSMGSSAMPVPVTPGQAPATTTMEATSPMPAGMNPTTSTVMPVPVMPPSPVNNTNGTNSSSTTTTSTRPGPVTLTSSTSTSSGPAQQTGNVASVAKASCGAVTLLAVFAALFL